MSIKDFTSLQICQLIVEALRAELKIEADIATLKVRDREFQLPLSLITRAVGSILTKAISDETALYTENDYEILVNVESPHPFLMRSEALILEDPDNGTTFEISAASTEYLIWLICSAHENGSLADLTSGQIGRDRLRMMSEDASALDAVRAVIGRPLTLKIKTSSRTNIKRFHSLSNSLLFHLAYNLDLALVPQRYWAEISRRGRITRMRRSSVSEMDPPRRFYNEDLVNHYVLGISTDNPTVQFLSFYHVLEHFFESVFNDDLIENIKNAITQPSFSYKRKKDVAGLISTIKKSLQIRSETITFSELQALRITLSKFIDKQDIINKLADYDASLLDYYKNEQVPFSNGPQVDLQQSDNDSIVKNLANRIYYTRNALVHSKDGDKAKYTPFRDERYLVNEIPLLRFISESVILAVSELS
ncbi:hypothetical protein [Pseudomonas sp. MN1F]|uniref:hypothetical protein n=1 Tax=Pseudomonas sp. MN1F TaxID=1366632 RepID=UPI00128F64D7|nr:hypothetical protein [Pseudomonas sp. MN1F]MQG93109.1 hypothetical protein [Pseudomonas sp. MN1F]